MKSERARYEAYTIGAIFGQDFPVILEHIVVSYVWMADTFYLVPTPATS